MKVIELIKRLQKFPDDMEVMTCNDDPFFTAVGSPRIVELYKDSAGDVTTGPAPAGWSPRTKFKAVVV